MAAGHRYDLDKIAAQLVGQLLQLLDRKTADVGRILNPIQQRVPVVHIHALMPSIVMVRVGNPPPASHPIRPLMPNSGEYSRDFRNVKGFVGGGAPYGSVSAGAYVADFLGADESPNAGLRRP